MYDILDKIILNIESNLSDKDIHIKLSRNAKDYFVNNGYDENFGARPLKRLVTKELETLIAKKIIDEDIEIGTTIMVEYENNAIVLK